MKAKRIAMRITDIIMTGNLLFLMALQVTQQFAHEWLGIAMTVLFIVHHIMNYKYYKTIFKGKYNTRRGTCDNNSEVDEAYSFRKDS